mgnify:FL=1
MEKRVKRSRPLSRLLLGYLLRTGLACAAAAALWFGAILAVIETGFVLPAYSGSDAALRAMEILPEMSAEHFDASALPELCRWVVLDTAVAPGGDAAPENVLATNMDSRSLELALGLDTPPLYTQFYRDVPLIDGTLCRLQYDFALPYADPALRGVLPDFQSCMTVILFLLLAGVVFTMTRRTARRLRTTAGQLAEACRLLAGGDLAAPMPGPTRVREFDEALQTMDRLRGELAQSLKTQWAMEQQRAERMAALTHDLKTPLAIVQGNAELLAEEELSAGQRPLVEAILRGAGRAGQYLAALRDICRVQDAPAPAEDFPLLPFCENLAETGRALCAPRGVRFACAFRLPDGLTLHARRQDLARAVENLLANAARFAPQGGQVTLACRAESGQVLFTVQDDGPGFPDPILRNGGQMFATGDAARSDGHQGLGLYWARTVAEAHGGRLTLANTGGGALAVLAVPAAKTPPS